MVHKLVPTFASVWIETLVCVTNQMKATLSRSNDKTILSSTALWYTIYCPLQTVSYFWSCEWFSQVWPFKWKLPSGTFPRYYLLHIIRWLFAWVRYAHFYPVTLAVLSFGFFHFFLFHSINSNLKNWAGDRAREQRCYFKRAIFPELSLFTVACQRIRDVRGKTSVASDYLKSSIKPPLSIKHPLSLIRPSFSGEESN